VKAGIWRNKFTDLLPCFRRIRLPGPIDGTLEVSQLDQAVRELGEVADGVEEDPRGVMHSLLHAPISHLLDGGIVRFGDELLQIGHSSGLS